jgi:chromosome partitioning protein
MMRTVLVANRKGGCGKTMVAITLASALAADGASVALADADTQKSALHWLRARPAGTAPVSALDWTHKGDIGDAPKRLDWLVIDAPGALKDARAEALIAAADALVAPVLPSGFDADSTRRFLRDIEELKRVRKGRVGVHLVANRMRAGRAGERQRAFFEVLGEAPVAWIAERSVYADLAAEGLSVFDRPQKGYLALQAQWAPILAAVG